MLVLNNIIYNNSHKKLCQTLIFVSNVLQNMLYNTQFLYFLHKVPFVTAQHIFITLEDEIPNKNVRAMYFFITYSVHFIKDNHRNITIVTHT